MPGPEYLRRYFDRPYLWKQDQWNGGQAEDSRIGLPGASLFLIGLDIRSDSGYFQLANATKKHSDTTISGEVDWMDFNPANLDMYHYMGTSIVKESGGTYSSVHTLSVDSPNMQGLADFNGYLYYATDTQLGRFDYNTTWADNWQTGLTSSRWHPMCKAQNKILIGHGRYVATVDDVGTFTLQALSLPPGYYVRHIFRAGSKAVILATYGKNVTDSDQGMCFLWNTFDVTYDAYFPIDGNPHAGFSMENQIYIIAGNPPTILKSSGGPAVQVQSFYNIANSETAEVYPGAIDIYKNMLHFGFSAGTAANVQRALWNFGSKNAKFTDCLNAEYIMSTGNYLGATRKITAVKKIGNTIRYAWTDGTSYGIDYVDTTSYQPTGILRSLVFDRQSPYVKTGNRALVEFSKALNSGESVLGKVSTDPYNDPTFADSTKYASLTASYIDTNNPVTGLSIPLEVSSTPIKNRDLAFEITLTGPGTSSPRVKRFWALMTEEQDQLG